jgi:pilus assembly protein CpaF
MAPTSSAARNAVQLLIENTLTAHTEIKELLNQTYRLGRAKDCEIPLPSKFISRYQAEISYSRKGFMVQLCGANTIYINDLELGREERLSLSGGDRIKIGEYVLRVIADTQETPAATRNLDLAKKFVELETRIHDQLLERLELRKANLSSTKTDEHIQLVHKHLTVLLNEFSFDLEPETEDYIVRETLKMELMDRVTLQDSKRRSTVPWVGEDWSSEHDHEAEHIKSSLASEMRFSTAPGDVKENAHKLEKNFDEAMKHHWVEMSGGLKRYLLKRRIRKDIHDIIFGLGPLQDLLNSPSINEIMVVSRNKIYIEKNGRIEESGRAFVSDEVSYSIIERIVSPLGRRIDKAQPLVDARLADGARVNAIIPPLALKGPCITIRKFSRDPITIDDLLAFGSVNERAAHFLNGCVRGRKNIIISGGTGSGKTTLLNVLSAFIEPQDRIVTIEDSAELQLRQEHVVQLETKPANIEGSGAFTIRDLVKNALRMRPDRIIVGECRGGEALDMLQAMNTGHSGSMTTAHANSPEDMMLRLETMVLTAMNMPVQAIRSQVSSAIDIVVQASRTGGKRRVTQITEVVGMDEEDGTIILEDIFVDRPNPDLPAGGELTYTGYMPTFLPELVARGYVKLDKIF